ncbi:MAG: DciA family protein [Candidatus Dasytiphilus stammeri]
MRYSNLHTIEKILTNANNQSILQILHKKVITLINLDYALKQELPSHFHPWCRVANLRQHILIIETANAHWLTYLRYQQPILLSILQNKILPTLVAINLVINPSLGLTQSISKLETKKNRTISKTSAIILRNVARQSPDNIKSILERLASLANDSNTN